MVIIGPDPARSCVEVASRALAGSLLLTGAAWIPNGSWTAPRGPALGAISWRAGLRQRWQGRRGSPRVWPAAQSRADAGGRPARPDERPGLRGSGQAPRASPDSCPRRRPGRPAAPEQIEFRALAGDQHSLALGEDQGAGGGVQRRVGGEEPTQHERLVERCPHLLRSLPPPVDRRVRDNDAVDLEHMVAAELVRALPVRSRRADVWPG